jgi:excisionase family DNA binding protein
MEKIENVDISEKLDRIENKLYVLKSVFTVSEAAQYLGISVPYLYKLTSSKKIGYSKPNGKQIYFSREKLDNWMQRGYINSKQETEQQAASVIIGRDAKC